jgi:alpha-beta hydrolase superfamily lysophospholipase
VTPDARIQKLVAKHRKRPLLAADADTDLIVAKAMVKAGKAPRSHLRRAVATYLERGAWDRVIDRQLTILFANDDCSSDN